MKRILPLMIVSLSLSCNSGTTTNQSTDNESDSTSEVESAENFDWLNGDWKRLNDEDGKETFERWKKVSPTEYSGHGFTMQQSDTIWQEQMQLIAEGDKWNLHVKAPEDTASIEFKMETLKNKKFVCINDSLDFPNKIQYWIEGEKLMAEVSNEEMSIPFEFEKIK